MSRWKILVTAQAFAVSGQAAHQLLIDGGHEVVAASKFGPLTLESLTREAHDCDAIIAATDPYDHLTFAALPKLKLVARCGVGVDSVNMQQATDAGVLVTNVPHAMTDAVADYCMGLLLTMVRRIHEGYNCMVSGGWAEFPGVELRGKQLGLIGFGKIGQAVADRALGFGLDVVAFDPMLATRETIEKYPRVRWVTLEELYQTSNFISVHAPNTPQTRHMVNQAAFRMMRKDCYLINSARGALIDESALIDALKQNQIAGAAIDVYCQEPLPSDHPLRSTPRLLLTPHNAFNSSEAAERMSMGCAAPILDIAARRVPEFLCNPSVMQSENLRVRRD